MESILVLGSEGFIGSHAVAHFRSLGHRVFCADIVLKEALDYSIINPEAPNFASLFIKQPYLACINATGAANVQLSFGNPSLDYALNVSNVYHLLDAIRLHQPTCKFVNLSSAAIYGNPISLPIHEQHQPKPVSPYGWHKLYAEQICSEFYQYFGVATQNARIFSAYGPGLKKQLFWDLYNKISSAKDHVDMFGTGKETRDFIYIDDLTHALERLVMNAPFKGGCTNLASGIESGISEAVDIFISLLGKNVIPCFTGIGKFGDPINWRADISELRSYGFEQKVSLHQGINQYITWLKEKG